MKKAVLPNGKILKFPEHTPEDAIDQAVREHMREDIERAQREEDKEFRSLREHRRMHMDKMEQRKQFHQESMDTTAKYHAERAKSEQEREARQIARENRRHADDKLDRNSERQSHMTFTANRHADQMAAYNKANDAINNLAIVVDAMNANLNHVVSRLDAMAQNSQKIEATIAKVTAGLDQSLNNAANLIASAFTAPKQLTVDQRGRPVGVKSNWKPD